MRRFTTSRNSPPTGDKGSVAWILPATLFWLLLWQFGAMALNQKLLLVSPIDTVATLLRLMGTSAFYRAVLSTMLRILLGFFLSLVVGGLLGWASAFSRFVRTLLHPLISVVSATPVASFVILVLVMIRSQDDLSIYISFLMVLPVIYLGVLGGFAQTDQGLLVMTRVFRVGPLGRARAAYLPALMPQLLTACRVGLGMCWKSGLAAEVIAPPNLSIGEALYRSKLFWATDEVFAWTLAVVLLSVLVEKLALLLIRRIGQKFGEV